MQVGSASFKKLPVSIRRQMVFWVCKCVLTHLPLALPKITSVRGPCLRWGTLPALRFLHNPVFYQYKYWLNRSNCFRSVRSEFLGVYSLHPSGFACCLAWLSPRFLVFCLNHRLFSSNRAQEPRKSTTEGQRIKVFNPRVNRSTKWIQPTISHKLKAKNRAWDNLWNAKWTTPAINSNH